jgi:FlgN protein
MSSGTLASITVHLCRLLDREEAACRALLETVQEERTAIRTLAITEFHGINSRRLAILDSLRTLAQERDGLVRDLAQCLSLPPATTIHGLIDRLASGDSTHLRTSYNSFMAIAKTVRAEIKQNVVLIEGIRGVVDQALSAGAKIVPGLDLYNSGGHCAGAGSANLLIHQQG